MVFAMALDAKKKLSNIIIKDGIYKISKVRCCLILAMNLAFGVVTHERGSHPPLVEIDGSIFCWAGITSKA